MSKITVVDKSKITVVKKSVTDPEQLTITLKVGDKQQEEIYSLNTKPAFTSQLVLLSQGEILQNLSLDSVVLNLKNSADLMYVAYNALAGTQIQSKMSGLQYELLQASNDSITTVRSFATQSDEVIGYIVQSYKWLFKNKETLAVKQLQRCAEIAKTMAAEAKSLSVRFTEIGSRSQLVLQDSTDLMNLKEQEKLDFQQKLNDLKAYQANAKKLQAELQSAFDEVQQEFEAAREREKVEGDRAFALGIVSATVGAIASGLGSIAQTVIAIKSPIGIPGGGGAVNASAGQQSNAQTSTVNTQATSSNKELTEKLEKAQAEKNQLERQKTELENKITTNKKNIEQFKDQESKQKEQAKLQENERQLQQLNQKIEAATQAVNTILDGLKNLSAQIGQLSNQAHSAAELASKQKMEFYKAKNEIAAENRKALAQIEEYAVRVSNTNLNISNAELAVQTIFCAVQALSRIVTALDETALFWESMAKFCNRLGDSKFLNDVKDLQELDPDERLECYSESDFLRSAVQNLCGWAALNKVCQEYLVAVNEAYKLVQQNINTPLPPEQARAQTPNLAKKILQAVRDEKATLDVKAQPIL